MGQLLGANAALTSSSTLLALCGIVITGRRAGHGHGQRSRSPVQIRRVLSRAGQ